MFIKFLAKRLEKQFINLLRDVYPVMDFEFNARKITELTLTVSSPMKLTEDELIDIRQTTNMELDCVQENEDEINTYIFKREEIKDLI